MGFQPPLRGVENLYINTRGGHSYIRSILQCSNIQRTLYFLVKKVPKKHLGKAEIKRGTRKALLSFPLLLRNTTYFLVIHPHFTSIPRAHEGRRPGPYKIY